MRPAGLTAALMLMLSAATGWAQSLPGSGNTCLPDLGNGKLCTARDLEVVAEILSGPEACQLGDRFPLSLRFTVGRGAFTARSASERYGLGFFLGEDGARAINPDPGGACAVSYLTPNVGTLNLASGAGPYRELSSPADQCGDIDANDLTVHDMRSDSVLCQDTDGDGRLDVSLAVTWENNRTRNCSAPPVVGDFIPNQSSKCLYDPDFGLDIPVESEPALVLRKVVTPSIVVSPSGRVTYTIAVDNVSSSTDTLTLDSLVDDQFGNLNGVGDCALPVALAPGTQYQCRFEETITGSGGTRHINVVTASAVDEEGTRVTTTDDATVRIVDADVGSPDATFTIDKVGVPARLYEPGGAVEYTVTLVNTGEDGLQVFRLDDDRVGGSLAGVGSCQLPILLTAGAAYACQYQLDVAGTPGDNVVNTVVASAQPLSQLGVTLSEQALFAVAIDDRPASLRVIKTALSQEIEDPGTGNSRAVPYRLDIINTSVTDTISVTGLTDIQQ